MQTLLFDFLDSDHSRTSQKGFLPGIKVGLSPRFNFLQPHFRVAHACSCSRTGSSLADFMTDLNLCLFDVVSVQPRTILNSRITQVDAVLLGKLPELPVPQFT